MFVYIIYLMYICISIKNNKFSPSGARSTGKIMTKKEIKAAYEAGKCENLMEYIVTDSTKSDIINALYLLFKKGGDEYQISFESLPYSRGGKYRRHTSTLVSVQSWKVDQYENGEYFIRTNSSSKSAACPEVVVPKFYTEKGKVFHNFILNKQIEELRGLLLK